MSGKHSRIVGGSTAARRLNCPGSLDLEQKYPNIESSYAAEGSALHDVIEELVAKDISPREAGLLGEMRGSIAAMTPEHISTLDWAWRIVTDLIGDNEFALEQWGDFPGLEHMAEENGVRPGGTADVIIFHEGDKELTLADYKFGAGVPVEAKNNAQGMFYALCVANRYKIEPEIVTFHILQPRMESHTSDVWTWEDLQRFKHKLTHAINTRTDEYVLGKHCKFCAAEVGCPAKRQLAERVYLMGNMAKTDLPSALAMVGGLEDWIKSVKKAATAALEEGHDVQGWKLVRSRGERVWVGSEASVERKLHRRGLLKKQRITSKLISPAQAEHLLGKKAVDGMWEMVEGNGTNLVHQSDPRTGVNPAARDLSDLLNDSSEGENE